MPENKLDLDNEVRTRIAPSPTGELHIGSLRTVLYNWAFAKKNKGKFVLRIEDTDRERLVKGAVQRLLDTIKRFGITWDEGPVVGGPFKPYVQSQRLHIYGKYLDKLIENGAAYYCFCSKERLKKIRSEQVKKGVASPKYDRHCRSLSADEVKENLKSNKPYVIRLKVPDDKDIVFDDLILGEIKVSSNELDDQVLIKSDGFPTYHFAVVVDDHLMKITHVMRGNEWIPSTPKHILLYKAFGWETPFFAHLPNLKEVGAGKKMSKRVGDVNAQAFLDNGYLPEAILNFLMFLGWNPGGEKEFYSLGEFVSDFSIDKIHKSDLVAFDRNKLLWMNGQYIQKFSDDKLTDRLEEFYKGKFPKDKILEIIPLIKTRIKTLTEFEQIAGFFFSEPKVDKKLFGDGYKDHLKSAYKGLTAVDEWEKTKINEILLKIVQQNDFKTGKFFMDLRIAVCGSKITPPINESLVILGKKVTLKRLEKLII